MNPLSYKQTVKVQAALALIHDYGHDAKAVGRAAQSNIARGLDPKVAYERALTEFSKGKPDIANALSKTLRVIEASIPATVSAYGEALEKYNQTGDPSATAAIAQTFVADSIALAVHLGELSQEDARNPETVEAAFGFAFAPGAGGRVVAMASLADGQAATAAQAPPAAPAAPSQIAQAPEASASAPPPNGPRTGYAAPTGAQASASPGWRTTSFQPIIRQKTEPGSGPVLEKAGVAGGSDTYG